MKFRIKTKRAQKGFTLIELLVAVAVTALVLLVLITVFSNQSKVFSQQTDLTQSTAAARAAMQMMSRDIRVAGWIGIPLGWEKLGALPVVSIKDGNTPIGGPLRYHDTGDNLISRTGQTDAIEIWGNFSRRTTSLRQVANSGASQIRVQDASVLAGTDFNRPAYVAIGEHNHDAKKIHVELFELGTVDIPSGTVNFSGFLFHTYGATSGTTTFGGLGNVVVSPVYRRVYYVEPDRTGDKGIAQPTLFIANYGPNDVGVGENTITRLQLARGVIDLQITYDIEVEIVTGVNSYDRRVERNKKMVCDAWSIRNVHLRLWTFSDKFREGRPLRREFSHSVAMRNLGMQAWRTSERNPQFSDPSCVLTY